MIKEYLQIVTRHDWGRTAILKVKSSFWKGIITLADDKPVERILSLFAQLLLQRSFEIQFGWIDPEPRLLSFVTKSPSPVKRAVISDKCYGFSIHVYMVQSAKSQV